MNEIIFKEEIESWVWLTNLVLDEFEHIKQHVNILNVLQFWINSSKWYLKIITKQIW